MYSDTFPNDLFINREGGIEPDLYYGFTFNGLMDCRYKVTIEKDVFTGHDVMFLTGSHDYTKFGDERRLSIKGGPIIIHEGVWIASRVIILGPTEIGKHSVIGAGSVVTHKIIPAYEVWAGNPARKIKEIPHI